MFRSTRMLAIAVAAAMTGVMLPGPAAATPREALRPGPVVTAATPTEAEVVRLTNRARARHGCHALRIDGRLTTAARRHSADMARNNFFSHTGSDGSDFVVRANRAGYGRALGENIALGQRTATEVVKAWMDSTDHRLIILNCSAKAIGVGMVKDRDKDRDRDGVRLWTQVFGYV